MRSRLEIPGVHQAPHDIHFPVTEELAAAAQRRFKLQELLVLQLALSMHASSVRDLRKLRQRLNRLVRFTRGF